jgi:hypothetical protein
MRRFAFAGSRVAAAVVGAELLEQPAGDLLMSSLWPAGALGAWFDAADAAVSDGDGLGAMPTSGGAVANDDDTTSKGSPRSATPSGSSRSATFNGSAVISRVPARPVVEATKEKQGRRP